MVYPISQEDLPVSKRRETVLGVTITFAILAFSAVAFRLYARFKLLNKPGYDDALIVFSMLSLTSGTTFVCLAAYSGLGQHFLELPQDVRADFQLRFYGANASYVLATLLLKLSLLCQYLRMFDKGRYRTACFVIMAFCLVWGCISTFMAFFPCFPVNSYWDWTKPNATCYGFGSRVEGPFVTTYVTHSVLNLVFDFIILVLPAPIVFRKALTTKEKLSALGLGSLGMVVIAMCAWRTAEVVVTGAGFRPTLDFTWRCPTTIVLACVEVYLGIIAVSMPVFWPILEAQFFGIVVQHEVHVTSRHVSAYDDMDGDSKSEHGSEAALGPDRKQQSKNGFYTEDLELDPLATGRNNLISIGARKGSQASLVDLSWERLH